MGQKVKLLEKRYPPESDHSVSERVTNLSVFSTDFGWFGLWGSEERIFGLTIGHPSPEDVRCSVWEKCDTREESLPEEEFDWHPEIRRRLVAFSAGKTTDFSDVDVLFPKLTPFQQRVLETTRGIEYGCTLTYGQLAEHAGTPRAARAVGSVMASNRVPIIIPCHRVVAAGGKWGGFSAPQGVSLKRRLLQMEADVAEG